MKLRTKVGLGIAVGLALGLVAYWASQSREQRAAAPSRPGRTMAADFRLKDASGKEHSLAALKGKPIVLHFWASWCPPCIEEIPEWLELAKSYEGKPVNFVAVSLDTDWEAAHKILPEAEVPKNVISVLDAEKKVPEAYGSFQFPESYLVSSRLEVARKWVGQQEWAKPEMKAQLEQAIAED